MLQQRHYKRLFSFLALAYNQKYTIKSHSAVFVTGFSPPITASAASYCLSTTSSTLRRNMLSNDAVEEPEELSPSKKPPTLLVHGLDSSSHTWRGVLKKMSSSGLTAVAIDQRGCGKSPLGDPDRFSPDLLVNDLYSTVSSNPVFRSNDESGGATIKPFVLVGHSMGGRLAMSFAVRYPELIAALVIEDMDIRTRPLSESRIQSKDRDATLAFDRKLTGTPEKIIEAFEREGYPKEMVESWFDEGRISKFEEEGNDNNSYYYSQVNPAFRLLCYEQFFETNHGEDTWKKLAGIVRNDQQRRFPIHLMIADPEMTICDKESVSTMKDAMDELSSSTSAASPLTIHRYAGATHSIHNSLPEAFAADLEAIIENASAKTTTEK